MQDPDPFMMTRDQANEHIAEFLTKRSFNNVECGISNSEVDVRAEKLGWRVKVESKGSRARAHTGDTVFDSSQLWIHLCEQVGTFMRYQQSMKEFDLLLMGNPDLPRFRRNVAKIEKSLDRMGIIRLWVQLDGTVRVEAPQEMAEIVKEVGL
jgi:hypothetical protein